MKQIWNTYEDMEEIIYAADMDTYELLYLNKRARELYGITSLEQVQGKMCYQVLQNNAAPCAICTNCKLVNGKVHEWEFYNQFLKQLFILQDQMIIQDGRRIRVEVARNINEVRHSNHRYSGIDDTSLLINECMRMALEETDADQGIQRLMEYLGHTLNGERAYIFELSEQNTWNNTYEWCANGVTAEKDFLQGIPYETIDLWMREFIKDQFIVVRDVDATKETQPEIYEYLQPQNIHSIIVGPLYENEEIHGFYGIDNPPVGKIDEVANMLKTIGHVIETMITKRKLVRKLENLSFHDQMLQLGNRHAVNRYFEALDPGASVGVIFCDVCGLKRVNDTMGHAAGDELLRHVCSCLWNVFPKESLFRIGGDEMLVLLDHIDQSEFQEYCEKLQVKVLEDGIPLAVGCVWKESLELAVDDLIAEADAKMYEDKVRFYKHAGMNRWRSSEAWFGTSTRYEEIVECVHNGLDQAIEEGQFIVYFQPQYNQRENSLYGAEALVRWVHPEKGLLSPYKFIPYLEQNGMISKLDEFVLRETCRYQKKWLDAGLKPVPISVNLSRKNLQSDEICFQVKHILEEFDLPVQYINLEVTETAYMEQPETVNGVVEKFREFGFKVEMDDFGSGYSSLNSLKDISMDILKLDMKFVSGDRIDDRCGKILSSVVRMAHWIGMIVIAEGVETKEQSDFLEHIGCYYVQGYYFDKPMPAEMFEQRLIDAKPDLNRDTRLTQKNMSKLDYLASDGPVSLLLDSELCAAAILWYDGEDIELIRGNEAMYEMFGYSGNRTEEENFVNLFYQKNLTEYKAAMEKAIETMSFGECSTLNISLNDPEKPFWVHTKFKYINGYDGIYTFLINVENIDQQTKTKQMNIQLCSVMDWMEKRGIFGAVLLQLGKKDQVTYFNDNMARLLGYTHQELQEHIDQDIYSVMCKEDGVRLKKMIREAAGSKIDVLSTDIHYISKKGAVIQLPVIGIVSRVSETNQYVRLMSFANGEMILPVEQGDFAPLPKYSECTDEQKEELQNTKEILKQMGGAYVRCSMKEHMILEISEEYAKLLNYPASKCNLKIYNDFVSLVSEEDRNRVCAIIKETKESKDKKSCDFLCRMLTGIGEDRWTHVCGSRIVFPNNRTELFFRFELVDQESRQEQIRKIQLNHIMENSPNMGITCYRIVGKRWSLEYFNESYINMLGYTREQLERLIENDLLAVVHPDERERVRSVALSHVKVARAYDIQYRILTVKGDYIWMVSHSEFVEQDGELHMCQLNASLSAMEKLYTELKFRYSLNGNLLENVIDFA